MLVNTEVMDGSLSEVVDEPLVEAFMVMLVEGVGVTCTVEPDTTGGPIFNSKNMMVSEKGSLANWVSTSLP